MANLGQLIPAMFIKDGELLTPEQIKRRQALSANALAFATDTSPNAGGVASILAKGLAGFRSGWEENRANAATAAAAKENQSLISGLLSGTSGMSQGATVAAPTVAPMQNVAPTSGVQTTQKPISVEAPAFANDGSELGSYLADPNKRSTLPAGMRNNNPGNIKFVGQKVPGIVGPSVNTDQGDPQAVFDTPESGMKAMYTLLLKKYTGGKISPNQMIAGKMGWTPGNYDAAANVARTMGISPDDDIGLNNPERASRFMQALILQEHGQKGKLYSQDMIRNAIVGGGSTTPSPQPSYRDPFVSSQPAPQTGVNPTVIAALSSPVANENTRAVASLLLNNQFQQQEEQRRAQQQRENFIFQQDYQQQQQSSDPLRQLQIQEAQQKLARGPNADENFYGNPVAIQNADGTVAYGQIGNRGTFKPIQLGEGQSFAPPTRTIDAGTETILVDQAGNVISRTPKNNRTAAAETAGGTVEGRVAAERQTSASSDIQAGQNALDVLNQIENHPGLSMGTGITSLANRVPGTEGYNFQNIVEQAKSGAFLSAIQQMRGLGALSNNEGAAATSAITRMDTATSKDAFLKALADYRKIVQQGIDRAQKNLRAPDDAATTQQPPAPRRKYNPATGRLE